MGDIRNLTEEKKEDKIWYNSKAAKAHPYAIRVEQSGVAGKCITNIVSRQLYNPNDFTYDYVELVSQLKYRVDLDKDDPNSLASLCKKISRGEDIEGY